MQRVELKHCAACYNEVGEGSGRAGELRKGAMLHDRRMRRLQVHDARGSHNVMGDGARGGAQMLAETLARRAAAATRR